ncbi:unnamed protein product [Citrullus colocynthis]|uniref:TCP domain-containing protein n=1 Tax=Citrullus colocynthis TaxID=252529 RepID=A0ABP0ZA27_9ROSI
MGSQRLSLNDGDNKTAKLGRRDRRIRSSIGAGKEAPTGIEFYDVEDHLGCDRPIEAIGWLLQDAKSAIDALSRPLETEDSDERRSFSSSLHIKDFSEILEVQLSRTKDLEKSWIYP